jgi:peptide/nickel transport system substrate-binding protein
VRDRLLPRHSRTGLALLGAAPVALGLLVIASAVPSDAQERPALTVLTATGAPRQTPWSRSFNPFRADSLYPTWGGVYEPLIVCNYSTGDIKPWLATSYSWSPDNLVLRFTTRAGVTWSDGTPFSAADVAFTFDLMRRFPAVDRAAMWQFLADVTAPDAQTAVFRFKRPYTPGLLYVGEHPIVPAHKWRDVAQPESFDDPAPVGTGPFATVRKFEPTAYELGRNRTYWQTGKPAIDVLRMRLYRSNDEVARALGANEVDWASLFLPNIEKDWVGSDSVHHQYWYPDSGPTVLLYLNTRLKPFDDGNVRKAVSMALDRPRITKDAMKGYAAPADATGLAESQKRWKNATLAQAPWTRRDVAAANGLLDSAGLSRGSDGVRAVPGGGAMRYSLPVPQGWSDWNEAADIIRQNLADVGIAVTLRLVDMNTWNDTLRRNRFELGIGFGNRGQTPYEFYRGQMDTTLVRPEGEVSPVNFQRFGDVEATALLRRLEATSDPAEMTRLIDELQKQYVVKAPSIPLFTAPLWGVYNTTRITGFPSRFRPYGGATPGGQARGAVPSADSLPVLLEVRPR